MLGNCVLEFSWMRQNGRDSGREVVLEGLLEEFGPVFEGGCHHAAVDEVEFIGVRPWFFCVINLKSDIWWDEAWLY